MIIRILGEGQWEVPADELAALNHLDSELEAAVHAGDDAGFAQALPRLLAEVRASGTRLPDEQIATSEVILPPVTATIEEVAALLSGDGLIPG
ncbi:MAG TPA: hypothetical protein VGN54_01250 [Mycobacteriales bacterium]|nr:hypothetical protein [Mycobacteriales bacterium]